MVSKLRPMRLGSRNVFFTKSQVPSPTTIVPEEYDADPGAENPSAGAMVATTRAARLQDRGARECAMTAMSRIGPAKEFVGAVELK